MKGQTIIEVVVALGAAVIILTAMILVILTSLGNSEQGTSESLATYYAEQGMELMRQMKENNWTIFSTLNGNYCMAESCTTLTNQAGSCGPKSPSCAVNVANKYIREVLISRYDASCRPPNSDSNTAYFKVATIVYWTDSKCTDATNPYCHTVKLESCLSQYGVRSAP